jgi:hypothetical protein
LAEMILLSSDDLILFCRCCILNSSGSGKADPHLRLASKNSAKLAIESLRPPKHSWTCLRLRNVSWICEHVSTRASTSFEPVPLRNLPSQNLFSRSNVCKLFQTRFAICCPTFLVSHNVVTKTAYLLTDWLTDWPTDRPTDRQLQSDFDFGLEVTTQETMSSNRCIAKACFLATVASLASYQRLLNYGFFSSNSCIAKVSFLETVAYMRLVSCQRFQHYWKLQTMYNLCKNGGYW